MYSAVQLSPLLEEYGTIKLVDIIITNEKDINSMAVNYWYDNCRTICEDMYGITFNGVLTDPELYNDTEDGNDYIIMSLHVK